MTSSNGNLPQETRDALLKAIKDEVESRTVSGGLLELAQAFNAVMDAKVPKEPSPPSDFSGFTELNQ